MLRIYIECHPNEDMRTAHLSIPVTPEPYNKYDTIGVPARVKLLENLLDHRIEITAGLADMVARKEIRFERNKAFSWDETIAAVVEVLGKFFNQPTEVEIMERNPEWDQSRDEGDRY